MDRAPAQITTDTDLPKQVCYYYRHGKCKHGRDGKRLFNGKECSFLHPPKCLKYCRFGRDAKLGCVGPCQLFHPTLCRNSLKYRKCLSAECTFAHLYGTTRVENKTREELYSYDHHHFKSPLYKHTEYHAPTSLHQPANRHEVRRHQPMHTQHNHFSKAPVDGRVSYDEFVYKNSDFPPLSSHEDKISQISSTLTQMQKCIDYLMHCSANNAQSQSRPMANNSYANPNLEHVSKNVIRSNVIAT